MMKNAEKHIVAIKENGFTSINNVYSNEEIEQILHVIDNADIDGENFRKTTALFAIRQFLKEVPDIKKILFNTNFQEIIKQVLGDHFFIVKSIYFDKPKTSNWYVSYHQDLTSHPSKSLQSATGIIFIVFCYE